MVKALVQGFGGWAPASGASGPIDPKDIPADALKAMNDSVLQGLSSKAGRSLPVVRGKDRGLPKAAPVFDLEAMRQRNEAIAKKIEERSKKP